MENVVKTFKQLEELYNNHYIHEQYDASWDAHAVDYCSYQLDILEGWIIERRAVGDSVCGCDYCYQEFNQVVAWVEGYEPSDCQE